MQNDDWNRYFTVSRFLDGDFSLLPVTATTFYTQGFFGYIYSSIFPTKSLPVLTLIFGIFSFFIFGIILNKFFKQNSVDSILISLLLFLNPIFIYSLWGFMTELFLLSFVLLSIYFACGRHRLNFGVSWVLGFFAKQSAIVVPIGLIFENVISHRKKDLIFNILTVILTLGFYYYLFPQTNEMMGQKGIKFENLTSIKYIFSYMFVCTVYLSIVVLPLTFAGFMRSTKIFMYIFLGVILSIISMILFWQTNFPWKAFPYFPNVFTNIGYFYQGIDGSPYGYNYSTVFTFLSTISFLFFIVFILLAIKSNYRKIFESFEFYSLVIGVFLILVNPFVFDRYLLILFPFIILLFVKLSDFHVNRKFLLVFLFFQLLISIDYSSEFLLRQRIIWDIGHSFSDKLQINRSQIKSDHAWNSYYSVPSKDYLYQIRFYTLDCHKCKDSLLGPYDAGLFFTKSKIVLIKND